MQKELNLYEQVGIDITESEKIARPSLTFFQDVVRRFFHNKVAFIMFVLLIVLFLFSIFAPIFSSWDYGQENAALILEAKKTGNMALLAPSKTHWFGVDNLGRDLWVRTWMGVRYSLLVGVVTALISGSIGIIIGCIAGYFGGKVDMVIMRIIDVLNAVPYLIFVIIIMIVLGKGVISIIVALAVTSWLGMARLVRGQILQLKNEDYVLAAKALGTPPIKIILKHLIPNTMAIIIVHLSMAIPSAIFSEAFLSFLGIGIQAPQTSLGQLISNGVSNMMTYPYQLIIPAIIISVIILALQLIGDGLRDALDPKLRK